MRREAFDCLLTRTNRTSPTPKLRLSVSKMRPLPLPPVALLMPHASPLRRISKSMDLPAPVLSFLKRRTLLPTSPRTSRRPRSKTRPRLRAPPRCLSPHECVCEHQQGLLVHFYTENYLQHLGWAVYQNCD